MRYPRNNKSGGRSALRAAGARTRRLLAGAAAGTLLAGVAIAALPALTEAAGATPSAPATPWTECPAVGADTSCAELIVINADGSVNVYSDGTQGPYDGHDDTLVGVVNNAGVAVPSVNLSSTSDIFGFDGDGICSYSFTGDSYCTSHGGQEGDNDNGADYEGPDNTWSNIASNKESGTVDFTTPVAKNGGTTYFSLESTFQGATAVLPTALSIVKSHVGSFVYGSNGTYHLAVSNSGGPTSGTVTLTDTLPTGLTFVSGSGGGFTCSAVGQLVTCTDASTPITIVNSPETIVLTVAVKANAGTVLSNSAAIGGVTSNVDQVTVSKAVLTVTANPASRNYGSANPTFTDAITGYVNGDTSSVVSGAASLTTTATTSSPVGPYTITCGVGTLSATNYSFNCVNGTLTIGQAPLTITASSPSATYGGTLPAVTASYSGFVNGNTASSLSTQPTCSTTAKASSPVGSYATSCSGAVDSNYAISYVAGSLKVNQAALTITASSPSFTYGGSLPAITPSYLGFVNGDSASSLTTAPTCSTSATSSSAAGTYGTSCSGAVDANYAITYFGGTVTVNTAGALTITASSGSVSFGGAIPAITPSYSGFVNGDSASSLTTAPTCSTTASSGTSGSFATNCTGAVDKNYSSIAYVAGALTVGAKPVTAATKKVVKKTTPAKTTPAKTTPVVAATTVHTGEPWAGTGPLAAAIAAAGTLLLGLGELLRRRRRTA